MVFCRSATTNTHHDCGTNEGEYSASHPSNDFVVSGVILFMKGHDVLVVRPTVLYVVVSGAHEDVYNTALSTHSNLTSA